MEALDPVARPMDEVGGTPMAVVPLRVGNQRHHILLKLEGRNPGGSIKDRTARGVVEDLETRGLLSEGDCVVESTSGNLGVALAALAAERGYRFVAVMDPKAPLASVRAIEALGARVERVDEPDRFGNYLPARLQRVKEILADDPTAVWTDQYRNDANPRAHYRSTGPEILAQAGGQPPLVSAGVSTGGTLAGIASFLRRHSPRTEILAVDVVGSRALGCEPQSRLLTGIGSSRPSDFLRADHYNESRHVTDAAAFSFCRALRRETGIAVGGSSGAVLAATAGHLARRGEPTVAVCVCPDDGDKYADTIFDDDWLQRHGLLESVREPRVDAPDVPEIAFEGVEREIHCDD